MIANDDHAPYATRAADLLRVHLRGVVVPSPPPSPRERRETIDAITQALRQRRRRYAFAWGVAGLTVLVIAASAAAVLFGR